MLIAVLPAQDDLAKSKAEADGLLVRICAPVRHSPPLSELFQMMLCCSEPPRCHAFRLNECECVHCDALRALGSRAQLADPVEDTAELGARGESRDQKPSMLSV